ncbi:hypothetical protein INR49_017732 [Caranx melampygus]|nr:hypothetical protein INR49_017732 [Caranx melampygus]
MKLLVLALTVALLFTAGEALTCHRCIPKRAGGDCELSVETCKPGKDACATASFLTEPCTYTIYSTKPKILSLL